MLAGHDSTAMSLSWLLYDLALHPDDQIRVREEIRNVKSQSLTPDCLGVVDFESMTYTNAVIRVRRVSYIHPSLVSLISGSIGNPATASHCVHAAAHCRSRRRDTAREPHHDEEGEDHARNPNQERPEYLHGRVYV